ncbi:MAG: putative lipopolysaccharide heptosyltransferase III [SAR86 cluster bacterium]|nr:putative lipopolysaccharide heptosyltransferase III [SAR86 cluster bacterium]
MNKKFLIVILRFHGDVLLTKPMIDNIKLNVPDSEIDLLVYKGTGSILEHERNVSETIEIDAASKQNIFTRIKKEINLWKKLSLKKYDYAFFLTTQWRVVPISWALGKAMKAAVDDKKRRKNLWIKSFSAIFPEALENHVIQRNLLALESLGLKIFTENLTLDPSYLDIEYKTLKETYPFLKEGNSYCLIHPTSRREKKLWDKEKFGQLINLLLQKDLSVVVTSGPDSNEIDYVDEILKKAGVVNKKVLNLAGKTSLLGLAALIKGSQFFIGLDSVASHIAASVDKESITLFGPSNPVNWKPWSDKARIITREDLRYIEVKDVMSLVDEMPVE